MFVNLKINVKVVIFILIILFAVLSAYSIYLVFDTGKSIEDYDVIVMNTDNFTNILKEVHSHPENYYGQEIRASGYIFKLEDFKPNEFVLARNMIVCCEADPIVVGFLCKHDGIDKFEQNSWVEIEGILEQSDARGPNTPIIKITKISSSKIPKISNVEPPTI